MASQNFFVSNISRFSPGPVLLPSMNCGVIAIYELRHLCFLAIENYSEELKCYYNPSTIKVKRKKKCILFQ